MTVQRFSGGKCGQDANIKLATGMENLQELIKMEGQKHWSNLEGRRQLFKGPLCMRILVSRRS